MNISHGNTGRNNGERPNGKYFFILVKSGNLRADKAERYCVKIRYVQVLCDYHTVVTQNT
jgi:hypothetical protein